MTDQTSQQDREAFEVHYKHLDLTRDHDIWGREQYKHPHVQSIWHGWQAALKHAQPKDEWMVNLAIVAHCSNPTVEAAAKLIMDWYQGAEPDRAEAVESERDKALDDLWEELKKIPAPVSKLEIKSLITALKSQQPAQADKPRDCSNDPSSCPDNEGRGCYCTDNKLLPCPGAQADKDQP